MSIIGVIMLINLSSIQRVDLINQTDSSLAIIQENRDRMIIGQVELNNLTLCIDASQEMTKFFQRLCSEVKESKSSRFKRFFARLMDFEGGLANDPDDRGGLTKYGICKKVYPDVDIRNLTLEEAADIFRRDYYELMQIGSVQNEQIAYAIFDMGVLSGPGTAVTLLQQAINEFSVKQIAEDGAIGPKTLNAMSAENINQTGLLHMYIVCRKNYHLGIIKNDSSQSKFKKNWVARDFACLDKV